jgi:ribosomal protein S6
MFKTVSKFEDFLTSRGAEWYLKKTGVLKDGIRNPKKKIWFYHLFEFKVAGEVLIALKLRFRRDERVMRFLTVSLDKHAILGLKEEEQNLNLKSLIIGNITTICFRKKDGDIRYLTPLNRN